MKQQTVNEFKEGLNLDLHPLVTPKTVLTDNINGTFITYNGNEFCLQNDRGNKQVAQLTQGYTPIGIKEHNGILYIVSVNGDKTEIGTYPSPDYSIYDRIEEDNTNGEFDEDKYNNRVFESWHTNGNLEYQPLHVLENRAALTNQLLDYTVETPVTIEIQDSYDGSVNLILVANGKIPRIINSGFSINGEKYKFINREQSVDTNIYSNLNKESELIRTSNILTNVDLLGVQSGGQWKGGNYTFYIKFGDADYNQTDVVAESGIVSIFKGNDGRPSTISGTLLDERTDKMINLRIIGLNTIYSKIYIYFTREYSDTQGYRMTEAGMLSEPIDMKPDVEDGVVKDYQSIWLTGFEQQSSINIEELNVDYHTIDWARAETQHSNMLFLGNVGQEETFKLYQELNKLTHENLRVDLDFSIELPGTQYDYENDIDENEEIVKPEYYSVKNIYKYVGYWPNEFYRFGVVYIFKDGSKSPVFNMNGRDFRITDKRIDDNDKGVFLTTSHQVLQENNSVVPIGFTFTWTNNPIFPENVIGWFVVRQKRIPNTICQGLSIAVDQKSKLPVTYYNDEWITQSFLSSLRFGSSSAAIKPYLLYDALTADVDDSNAKSKWMKKFGFGNYWKYYDESDAVQSDAGLGLITIPIPQGVSLPTFENGDWEQSFPVFFTNMVRNSDRFNGVNYQIQLDSPYTLDIFSILPEREATRQFVLRYAWMIWLELAGTLGAIPVFAYRAYDNTDTLLSPERYLLSPFIIDTPVLYNRIIRSVEDWEAYVENITILNHAWEEYPQLIETEPTIISEPGYSDYISSAGLLSLDPVVNYFPKNVLDGSNFNIYDEYETTVEQSDNKRIYRYKIIDAFESVADRNIESKAVFVPSNTNIKMIGDYGFSTIAGNASDASIFKYFSNPYHLGVDSANLPYNLISSDVKENTNINLLRGNFTPFIGLTCEAKPLLIQSINLKDFNSNELRETDASVRMQDNSEYYTVSDYFNLDLLPHKVYRGDCFSNTVSMRILRNHLDPTVPGSETILDEESWWKWVTSKDSNSSDDNKRVRYDQVNLADVNTVALGYWVTFKCLSSYNLGLRSIDHFHTDEMSLLGSPRSFYPLNGASTATGNKVEESDLLNDGLSATAGRKRYNLIPDVPYSKSEFSNRIMFSNINVTDAFTNGYRTFQGLSYKDYDKQYGAITKLVSLGQNIFIVMEHGLGLVAVNPKALMQTTTGEAIHIYGYGVLPDEITVISQDYGSKYEHSVIRTPIGIYGIDVDALKIWRFSDRNGFETISDMKIETYLKDNLKSIAVELGVSDIRTHYNAKKGDLMFTWYYNSKLYSICYNERQNLWVTRYDWCPIVSENVNDEFYSLNIKQKQDSNNVDSKYYIWDHKFNVAFDGTHVSTWYDNDNGFEFEFVVSDPIGVNKIFDNLQIVSNNVQPTEMEITVIGDDYVFKRTPVDLTSGHKERGEYEDVLKIHTTSNIHGDLESTQTETEHSPKGYYHFDKRLNQSVLTKWQPFKDIYKFGRRIGNIQYKEGSWFAQIEPLLVTDERLVAKEARIRDKWAKIRIRYSGKDLAIITAIKTLINI